MQVCNPQIFTFDVTGSASLYSQMAGVLAAFAFGAISLVLPGMHRKSSNPDTRDNPRHARSDSLVLLALVAAFIGLIIATLEYAMLAGERGCALAMGRAASEEFLGGIAFAFAVLLLLYAIVQLIANSEIDGLSRHARFIVAILGAPLAVLFLTTGALDVASTPWQAGISAGDYFPNITPFRGLIGDISLPLAGGLLLFCFVAWLAGRRRRATVPKTEAVKSSGTVMRIAFPYISLALAVTAVVRSVSLDVVNPGARINDWEVWVWLIGCSVILMLQALLLSFDQGSEGKRRQSEVQGEADRESCTQHASPLSVGNPTTAHNVIPRARKRSAEVLAAKDHQSSAQLGWILILASLVTVLRKRRSSIGNLSVVTPRSPRSMSTRVPHDVLEPLNREVLIKRSLEAFPAGYLNNISIIQGVALGILAQQAFAVLGPAQSFWQRLGHIGEAVFLFCCILIVSYQYLWFLIIMRWTPDFRDTAIPIMLGFAEIVPMFLMAEPSGWLIGIACFAVVGSLAFAYTIFRLSPQLFPDAGDAHKRVGLLLRRLVMLCLAVSVVTITAYFTIASTEWAIALCPWCMLTVIPPLVLTSEGTLDKIYEHYGLQRRTRRSPRG